MAMAAVAQPAPGVFSSFKHGSMVLARSCRLFLSAFVLHVELSTVLLVFRTFVDAIFKAYTATRHENDAVDAEVGFSRELLLLLATGAAYVAFYLAAGLVRKVATASAAVAAYSGERHTCGSFLRKVRGNLLAGSATVVFGRALKAACASAAVLALPLMTYFNCSTRLFLLDALFAVLAFQFYFYLDVVCTMAVVAAVAAEPGRRAGPGAVVRAWRLMRGTSARALLYVVVTLALGVAVGPLRELAVRRLAHGVDGNKVLLVEAGLKFVLDFALDVFSMVAITAYYFECRKNKEDKLHSA